MDEPQECEQCGAPRQAGLVACSYCDTRYPGAPTGVSCPGCGDDNLPGQERCATCATPLLRACVFCAQLSSVAAACCARCGEPFEGAAERKRAREEQARQQQLLGLAASGLSVLGQAASSRAGRGLLDEVLSDLADAAMGRKK